MRTQQSRFRCDETTIAAVLTSDRWRSVVSVLGLSRREKQILESMLCGMDTEIRIADRLSISPRTVQTHIQRLRQKLGATSREQVLATTLLLALTGDTVDPISSGGRPFFR